MRVAALLLVASLGSCEECPQSPTDLLEHEYRAHGDGITEDSGTPWGSYTHYPGRCQPTADLRPEFARAYQRARRQLGDRADSISMGGLEVIGSRGLNTYGVRPDPWVIVYSCSAPAWGQMGAAVDHEIQHVLSCDALGHRGECCRCQDHMGDRANCAHSYDLNCGLER